MKVIQVRDFDDNLMCEFIDVKSTHEWYKRWQFSGRYCNGKVRFECVEVPNDTICQKYVPKLSNGNEFECQSSTNLTLYCPTMQPQLAVRNKSNIKRNSLNDPLEG